MFSKLTSRLFIEKDNDDNHEVVVKIGPVLTENDAVNIATYIYVTQNIDITDVIRPIDTTLH
jgi:hypothetical protein